MRLTVVGCSGSIPGPDSAASCYLVEAAGYALVVDLGGGALGSLQRHLDLGRVDAVLLSHLHPDHCSDLPSLRVALEHGPYGRDHPLPVLGPPGLVDRLHAMTGASSPDEVAELHGVLEPREIAEGGTELGPLTVTARRVAHPGVAYAYRVEHDGRVLAYSGDSAPCDALDVIARAADLALVEAAFLDDADNPLDLHHTGREAGELAARAGVARLVVTHVPPWHDPDAAGAAARSAYDGPVEVARPGVSYEA